MRRQVIPQVAHLHPHSNLPAPAASNRQSPENEQTESEMKEGFPNIHVVADMKLKKETPWNEEAFSRQR
jgi:hypothetical protein